MGESLVLPTGVVQLGNSLALQVPALVARFYKMKAGQHWHVRFTEHGPEHLKKLSGNYNGSGVRVIIPQEVVSAQGLKPGQQVVIHYGTWNGPIPAKELPRSQRLAKKPSEKKVPSRTTRERPSKVAAR